MSIFNNTMTVYKQKEIYVRSVVIFTRIYHFTYKEYLEGSSSEKMGFKTYFKIPSGRYSKCWLCVYHTHT